MRRKIMLTETGLHNIIMEVLIEAYSKFQNQDEKRLNENSIDRRVNNLISKKYNVTDFNEIRRIRSILLKALPNARARNEKWLPKIIEYMINGDIGSNNYLEFNNFLGWLHKNNVDDDNINDPNFNDVPFSYIKDFYQKLMKRENDDIRANADYRKVKTINGYTIRRLDSDEEAQKAGDEYYGGEWCVLQGDFDLMLDECTLYIVTNDETYYGGAHKHIPTYKTVIEKLMAMGKENVAKSIYDDAKDSLGDTFYPEYYDDDYFDCATLGTGLPPYDEYGMSAFVVIVGQDGHEYGVYSRYNLPNMNDGCFLTEVQISELLQADFRQVFPYVEHDDDDDNVTETYLRGIVRNVLIEAYPGLIDNDQNQDELHRVACQKGFNLIGYHNTREQFLTNFYDRSAGIHFGSLKAANDRGEQRDWDDDVQNWTNEYFLKVKNPLVIEKDFDWEMESFDYWSSPDDDVYYDDIDVYVYLNRELGFDIEGKDIKDILNEHGYDCIIYRNEREDVGNYSIAMFNPNHIKLARQTYDDNNNPIPLEQRFNTNTDDVRY